MIGVLDPDECGAWQELLNMGSAMSWVGTRGGPTTNLARPDSPCQQVAENLVALGRRRIERSGMRAGLPVDILGSFAQRRSQQRRDLHLVEHFVGLKGLGQ